MQPNQVDQSFPAYIRQQYGDVVILDMSQARYCVDCNALTNTDVCPRCTNRGMVYVSVLLNKEWVGLKQDYDSQTVTPVPHSPEQVEGVGRGDDVRASHPDVQTDRQTALF